MAFAAAFVGVKVLQTSAAAASTGVRVLQTSAAASAGVECRINLTSFAEVSFQSSPAFVKAEPGQRPS